MKSTISAATAGGQGIGIQYAHWVAAILYNGLGRYDAALVAAEQASEETPELFLSAWALPELIEASVRSGKPRAGARALGRLAEATDTAGGDWALGLQARSAALLKPDGGADPCPRRASIAWPAHASVQSWLVPNSSMGSGFGAKVVVSTRAARCGAHRTLRHDRHGGIRRTCSSGAAGDGRGGPPAFRRDARRAHGTRLAVRPARERRPETRRSARSCS